MERSQLEQFVASFEREPKSSGFSLDFDGTLSMIVETPSGVAPVPGAAETLEALGARYGVVALISGRRASDLAEIVAAPGVRYIGVYGAEEVVDGRLRQPEEAEMWRGMASRLARDAEALLVTEGLEGAEVEYKDVALSIHFRRASRPDAGALIGEWARAAAKRRGFRASEGRMVVEICPETVSKAAAVESLILEESLERLVAAGDDYADVGALEAAGRLLGRGALRVGVASPEEPERLRQVSDLVVEGPEQVLEVLRLFL